MMDVFFFFFSHRTGLDDDVLSPSSYVMLRSKDSEFNDLMPTASPMKFFLRSPARPAFPGQGLDTVYKSMAESVLRVAARRWDDHSWLFSIRVKVALPGPDFRRR